MADPAPLDAADLYRRCEPDELPFRSTAELEPLNRIVGQDRAIEALRFGARIDSNGYNLFVLGPPGIGKHEIVERFLREHAAGEPTPEDACYVHNFQDHNKPRLITLPAGRGERLCRDLEQLVTELHSAIPATFESDEYQSRLREIQQELAERQQRPFQEIEAEANRNGIMLVQTPGGFALAPRDEKGETMDPGEFRELPEERRREMEQVIERLQARLQEIIQQMPRLRKESQNRIRQLNEEMAMLAVGHTLEELREAYRDCPRVLEHLDAIRNDMAENADALLRIAGQGRSADQIFDRYHANLLVDNGRQQGAPVIYHDMPTHQHLVGRIEHRVHQGALLTDYRLIRPGALHRANGGYLLLDVRKLLLQPMAWEILKRTLYSGQIRTESLEQLFSVISTVSLEPEPVPLNLKVVLLGDRLLYYLLSAYDPDFLELFKVQADFEEDLQRTAESTLLYARMIATMARQGKLRPLDRTGVARIIEHGSRLAGDSERLTTHNRAIMDLLREADHWANEDGSDQIRIGHVQQAIDHQIYRASRIRERMEREIQRDTIRIDTDGAATGQVNGLSVIQLGGFAFGRPSRITATARLGRSHMVDIEREAKLGGNIHSKGVMILTSFIASRYCRELPLSLSASLAFEQSYGMVDGDSASVAELCALISVLADVPLKQSLAVTGSVDQHGHVQAVGGVNEKIEGFFDICRNRGLTGNQGVLLPAANLPHLMLRGDIREAAAGGLFHVYPLRTVDEAIGLMTGVPAGERQDDGRFPEGTVNRRVDDRLQRFSGLARNASAAGDRSEEGNDGDGDGER